MQIPRCVDKTFLILKSLYAKQWFYRFQNGASRKSKKFGKIMVAFEHQDNQRNAPEARVEAPMLVCYDTKDRD